MLLLPLFNADPLDFDYVCARGGLLACGAAGQGSIPGEDKDIKTHTF